jgi:hypothetical protein
MSIFFNCMIILLSFCISAIFDRFPMKLNFKFDFWLVIISFFVCWFLPNFDSFLEINFLSVEQIRDSITLWKYSRFQRSKIASIDKTLLFPPNYICWVEFWKENNILKCILNFDS